jgi:curved DNA-binding protein CbpA
MEAEDDPYTILGIHRGATAPQIRTAYRKAALRHHPDKVAAEERAAATLRFSKISHAYELLSDPQQRAQYDQPPRPAASSSSFPEHDFFRSGGANFHDPFEVFASVFGQEFGRRPAGSRQPQHAPVDAFFMAFPFGGGGRGDPFGHSFFGGGGPMHPPGSGDFFGRQESPFGRGFGDFPVPRDAFPNMYQGMQQPHMNGDAMRQHQQQHPQTNFSSYTSTSSSTLSRNGETVTTQTTQRRVNGQDESTTERIVRKADGTVERQLLNNNNNNNNSNGGREPPRIEGRRA